MSDVKRYTMVGPDWEAAPDTTGKWVRASDYDAAQVELAALREELAKFDEGMRALACSLGAGGYNAETLTADQLVGKVQWGIDHIISVQEQRLAAAEQRNSDAVRKIETALIMLDDDDRGNNFRRVLSVIVDTLKPAESGASE